MQPVDLDLPRRRAPPAIHECVVFGHPDEKWGEAVKVAIELREGADAIAEGIIAFANQQVGSVQAPKQVHCRGQPAAQCRC